MNDESAKLETALQLRNFEIELFWKRFNYFWLISAAALLGYVGVKDRADGVLLLVCCFGLVSSLSWTLLNIGSKWWHEAWEIKLMKYDGELEKGFFAANEEPSSSIFLFKLRRFSVSSVAVGISSYSVVLWFALATWHLLKLTSNIADCRILMECRYPAAFVGSIAFCVVITWKSYRSPEKRVLETAAEA